VERFVPIATTGKNAKNALYPFTIKQLFPSDLILII
jgi:hypothetical protein